MSDLILPWPHKDLSPNGRVHWSVKARAAAAARSLAATMARYKRSYGEGGWPGFSLSDGRIHLWVTFHPPTKRLPDDDNMLARFKPYRDGIADALGIDDKRFISHPLVSTEVRKGGCVVVSLSSESL